MRLSVSPAELEWLSLSLTSLAVWPPSEMREDVMPQLPDGQREIAGGPRLRAAILTLFVTDGPKELDLTPSDLWLLDTLLLSKDLRREKLSDGTPLIEFAEKVWGEIRTVYGYVDPQPAVESVEALLRRTGGHRG